MTEHTGRYETFAEVLTAHGVAVCGFDLRGHGKNGEDREIASFGEGGWQATLEDLRRFYELIRGRFPSLPYFLMGFSLGSFLVRDYFSLYPDGVDGAIIMGTGHQPGWVMAMMKAIVKGEFKKAGFDGTTPLVKQLSFETYNQKFKPNRTESDWLCADREELDAYIGDPLCRKYISAGLFWQLLDSMQRTGKSGAAVNWKKSMPVLLLSGANDPVGNDGKGVKAVYRQLQKSGMTDVTMQLFPDARHDLLHEKASGNAAKAIETIVGWMNARVK